MSSRATRRAWTPQLFTIVYWVIVWALAFAILSTSSSAFLYTLFGVAEPLLFLYHFFIPENSTTAYGTLVVFVAIQLALHSVAVILRFFSVSSPFGGDDFKAIAFIFLEVLFVILYLWYLMVAYRAYVWLSSGKTAADEEAEYFAGKKPKYKE